MSRRHHTTAVRRYRRHRGLSLVEALISLAITATLLTAVGAAYVGAARAVTANDQFCRCAQTARVSMNQLLSELRQCTDVDVSASEVDITTANGALKSYKYDATAKKVFLSLTNTTGVTTNYTLGSNVTACTFSGDSTNVTVAMSVTVGTNSITIGGSAVPRRKVVFH